MQLEQAVDADKENLPALHEEHVLADIAPVAGEKDPAAHSSHMSGCTAPSVGEKVPAAHSWHAAAEVAPIPPEYVPAPQSLHAALPLATLYLPATHWEHVALHDTPAYIMVTMGHTHEWHTCYA